MVTAGNFFSGDIALEKSAGDIKMVSSHFLEILRDNKGSIENRNKKGQEEEEKRDRDLFRTNLLSTWPASLETFLKYCRVQ